MSHFVPFCPVFAFKPGAWYRRVRGYCPLARADTQVCPYGGECLPPFPFLDLVFLWWGWVMQGGKGEVSIIREHEGGGRKDRDHGGGQGNRALDSDYRWQTSARHKTGRTELAEGPEILQVSPVTGPPVGRWDGV